MNRTKDARLSGVVLSGGMKGMRRVARKEQVLHIVDQIMGRTYGTKTSQRGVGPVR